MAIRVVYGLSVMVTIEREQIRILYLKLGDMCISETIVIPVMSAILIRGQVLLSCAKDI